MSIVRKAKDYSGFGVQLSGRTLMNASVTKQFRYGYQNSEQDDEIKGDGNSYTTEFRQLDPRLDKWLSIDPKFDPSSSPYTSMDNNPVSLNDVQGLSTNDWIKKKGSQNWEWDDKSKSPGEAIANHGEGTEFLPAGSVIPNCTIGGGGEKGYVWARGPGDCHMVTEADIPAIEEMQSYEKQYGPINSDSPGGTTVGYLHYDEGYAEQSFRQLRADMRFKNLSNGLDNMVLFMAGAAVAAPVIATVAVTAPVWVPIAQTAITTAWGVTSSVAVGAYKGIKATARIYHDYIGTSGGYQSFAGEVISQTYTQLYKNGSVSIGGYNAVGLFSSLIVTKDAKVLSNIQGVVGANLSISLNGKVDGSWNHSATYNFLSTANGLYGANATPYIGDASSGVFQGGIDYWDTHH